MTTPSQPQGPPRDPITGWQPLEGQPPLGRIILDGVVWPFYGPGDLIMAMTIEGSFEINSSPLDGLTFVEKQHRIDAWRQTRLGRVLLPLPPPKKGGPGRGRGRPPGHAYVMSAEDFAQKVVKAMHAIIRRQDVPTQQRVCLNLGWDVSTYRRYQRAYGISHEELLTRALSA